MQILTGLGALLAILAALHCYGRLALRFLAPGVAADAGIALAFGIALFNVLAGAFELSCTASPAVLAGIVALGVAGEVLCGWRRVRVSSRVSGVIEASPLLLLVLLLILLFLVNAAAWDYHLIDDRAAYLVFPRRILDQGCVGRDPFQFRRIELGLGAGGAYNYALFQSLVSVSQTRLADLGLGGVALLLLVYSHARELGLSTPRRAVALLIALGVIVFSPIINNTPETLGKALLYALLRVTTICHGKRPGFRRGAVIAILFCAVALQKTAYVPPAAAIVVVFYVATLWRAPLQAAREGACSAAFVVILLMPWMIVSYAIAQTAWYPLSGGGSLGTAEIAGFATLKRFIVDGGRLAAILAPACLCALIGMRQGLWRRQAPLMIGIPFAAAAVILAAQLKFTVFGYRYGQMGAATIFLFYVPIALLPAFDMRWSRRALSLGLAGVMAILISNNSVGRRWFSDGRLAFWLQGRAETTTSASLSAGRVPAYQLWIPPGQAFVALVTLPSLLDFARNPISVMDWPGMMGPPGMPPLDSPSGWARYLRAAGFRYLAYSYGDNAGTPDAAIAHEITLAARPENFSQYQMDLATHFRAAKGAFLALKQCAGARYDDGTVAVIDLATAPAECP